MILALRPQIVTVLLGLFALWPAPVNAGATPEQVKEFESYKAKAEKGDAKSQSILGLHYNTGLGVAKDPVEACTLRLLAGPRDAKKAQALADLQASLTPAELALAQERVQHYRKIIARNEAERGRPKHLR